MSNYKDIKSCVLKLIKYYNLKIKPEERVKIIKALCCYSELLIFNIVSVITLVCILNGHKRVTENDVLSLHKYIDNRCCVDKTIVIGTNKKCSSHSMKGGNMPQVYYSANEQNMYSALNSTSDIAVANLVGGIIRPVIGGGCAKGASGGFMLGGCDSVINCKNMNKLINKKVTSIFKFYKIISTKKVKEMLVNYFFIYINQLFVCIVKKTKGVLTLAKVKTILQKTNIMKK